MNVEEMSSELNKSFTSATIEDIDDMLEYHDVFPRIGDAYQADTPSLPTSLGLISQSNDSRSFSCGLPIPIMYVGRQNRNSIEEATNCQVTVTNKYESLETSSNKKGNVNSKHEDVDCKAESLFLKGDGNCSPLPGSQLGPWNVIEQSLFILGLYIFGKNLGLVKRFVGTKTMGDVLCYYYGSFYRSTYYRKWSEGRKSKSKRWIHGIKIFTGWRLQELVSRLSCYLSGERQQMLIEGSRMVSEDKISMEEYVFTLKDWVGSDVLVEAISIGKGKRDLTRTGMEPVKPTHSIHTRPDLPFGKGFSSLSSSEILQVLTGDSRLSKARSSDLFFEAVWPRLLVKGWQSSRPRDSFSKQSVVYLPPSIKEFSQGLIKGDEYFDSISDILHKVVSEPQLLQLEEESVNVKEEAPDDKMLSKDQQHYLQQPLVHRCDSMKFMVVDTSFVSEGAQTKVREFTSLPVGHNKFRYATSEMNYSTNVTECVTKSTISTELADDDLHRDSARLFGNPGKLRNIISDEQSRMTGQPLNVVDTIPQELALIACSGSELLHDIGNISTVESFTGGLESSKDRSSRSSASSHVEAPKIDYDENSYPRIVIDLNIPHASLGSECVEETITNEMQNNVNLSPNRKCHISDISNDPKASDILRFNNRIDHQPIEYGRRQSTRSRPSAKALEAIANGFLDAKKKRKTMSTDNFNSRRRVHAKSTDQTSLNNVA